MPTVSNFAVVLCFSISSSTTSVLSYLLIIMRECYFKWLREWWNGFVLPFAGILFEEWEGGRVGHFTAELPMLCVPLWLWSSILCSHLCVFGFVVVVVSTFLYTVATPTLLYTFFLFFSMSNRNLVVEIFGKRFCLFIFFLMG